MLDKIHRAGVVGAGGAGFPTHIKLKSKVEFVIANGAECEPLLQVDKGMMKHHAKELIEGLKIAMDLTAAKEAIIALKGKYVDVVNAVQNAIKGEKNIRIHELGSYYPAGDEFILVYEVTGRIVPPGGIPLDVGCVVQNVVTLINIYRAVKENKPVTHRPMSVLCEVKHPMTVIAPVGTPFKNVIEWCGGAKIADYVIIEGGPMMGRVVGPDDVVTKKTSGILVLPPNHTLAGNFTTIHHFPQTKSACEQCQDCTEICPRYLIGHSLRCHQFQRFPAYTGGLPPEELFECCECGLCDWVCPMRLLPRRINQDLKKRLIDAGKRPLKKAAPLKVRDMFEYRRVPLERIMGRFDLLRYDVEAPLMLEEFSTSYVKIPLKQHTGIEARPVVKIGDKVKKGDLIALVEIDEVGACVHASIDGTVKKVNGYIEIQK